MVDPDRRTRLCPNCYEQIDSRARVCPHCRRETWKGVKHGIKLDLLNCLLGLLFAPVAAFVMYLAVLWALGQMTRSLAQPNRPAVRHTVPAPSHQPPARRHR